MLRLHFPAPHHTPRQIYQRQSRSLRHSDLLGLFYGEKEGKKKLIIGENKSRVRWFSFENNQTGN